MLCHGSAGEREKDRPDPGGLWKLILLGRDLCHRSYLFLQGPGSVDGGAVAAGAPGQESTEGAPPLYNTNHDFKFSYSEINFQDLSWSFRNLYKSMLERSSSSQHGESAVGRRAASLFSFLFFFDTGSLCAALAGLELARQTRLASNLQRSACLLPLLVAGTKSSLYCQISGNILFSSCLTSENLNSVSF